MIRIYGGNVTSGGQDGIEVGTEENPMLIDGLYPAFNGSVKKSLPFAIRTDGEIVKYVTLYVAMLDGENRDKNSNTLYISTYSGGTGIRILLSQINGSNSLFYITANASGSEDVNISPDLRGKLYITPLENVVTILS